MAFKHLSERGLGVIHVQKERMYISGRMNSALIVIIITIIITTSLDEG